MGRMHISYIAFGRIFDNPSLVFFLRAYPLRDHAERVFDGIFRLLRESELLVSSQAQAARALYAGIGYLLFLQDLDQTRLRQITPIDCSLEVLHYLRSHYALRWFGHLVWI